MTKFSLYLVSGLSLCGHLGAAELHNTVYSLRSLDSDTVMITHQDIGAFAFDLTFCVFFSEADPKPAMRGGEVENIQYNVITWENKDLKENSLSASQRKDFLSVGDGFDPAILKGSKTGRTANLFHAASQVYVTAEKVLTDSTALKYVFPEHPLFTLQARVSLPQEDRPPVLQYVFTPRKEGYYAVGYVGAPSYPPDELDEIWQPMIWQEKRFPQNSFMTLAYRCTLPATLTTKAGVFCGVVVDPDEFPFDPLPLFENSRFGVALRDKDGLARPMVFAPVLGGAASKMKPNQRFAFALRPVIIKGDTTVAFEQIARTLYGFCDYRTNAISSVNRTLENMIDYGMSHWSRFSEDQKGCSYETDAPNTIKNVSSLNPLEIAIITDNEEIFKKRAYPYIEYMLSREKFLFTLDENQKIQGPSYTLEGPCAPVSELTALYSIFGKATSAFLELAEEKHLAESGNHWDNALALYRVTSNQAYLEAAVKGAEDYIRRRITRCQTDFRYGGFFWTSIAPNFIPLLELHEITGDERFLEAARIGARRFVQFIWMCPSVPDQKILVNKGGKAPLYWYLKSKGHRQMYIPEETVPAWRLSEIGLTSESTGTCTGHRAIFMANYAPWLLRIGYYAEDQFLRDVGRCAIPGRYRNFPGYHINTARTTVYEKADYPLHEHEQLSVNSFHYNHIWPMMSMLLDYLVTEAMVRSDGAIQFPSQFIEGYAYLQNKFYGAQKGRFFGYDDAVLWMPKGLLDVDNVEVNYIAARGENRLYLAFMNESNKTVKTTVALNEERIPSGQYQLRCCENGKEAESEFVDGTFEVEISPKGLTAVVLEGLTVRTRFQHRIMELTPSDRWQKGLTEFEKPAGRAMVLNLGRDIRTIYVYLSNSKHDFQQVDLVYDLGKGKKRVSDMVFPWEFTVPISADVRKFTFWIEGISAEDNVITKHYTLMK
jgi:hypothetical protein